MMAFGEGRVRRAWRQVCKWIQTLFHCWDGQYKRITWCKSACVKLPTVGTSMGRAGGGGEGGGTDGEGGGGERQIVKLDHASVLHTEDLDAQ